MFFLIFFCAIHKCRKSACSARKDSSVHAAWPQTCRNTRKTNKLVVKAVKVWTPLTSSTMNASEDRLSESGSRYSQLYNSAKDTEWMEKHRGTVARRSAGQHLVFQEKGLGQQQQKVCFSYLQNTNMLTVYLNELFCSDQQNDNTSSWKWVSSTGCLGSPWRGEICLEPTGCMKCRPTTSKGNVVFIFGPH